jgi:hypothetical protein
VVIAAFSYKAATIHLKRIETSLWPLGGVELLTCNFFNSNCNATTLRDRRAELFSLRRYGVRPIAGQYAAGFEHQLLHG